jgi:hypothetical protein
MIILRPYEPKVFMPVPQAQWRAPSVSLPKDCFSNDGVRTRFRVRTRLSDGFVRWTGWFEDRDDFDAFAWAIATGSLNQQPDLWRLPTPQWHPDIGEDFTFDFATQTLLTSTPGSLLTYTSPSDWNNGNNSVECIGGGGSGAGAAANHATGGGAGAYSGITNFVFAAPGTTTASYQIGTGGSAVTTAAGGVAGTQTWFNAAANPGGGADNSKCSADRGEAGKTAVGTTGIAPKGGAANKSWGTNTNNGGSGGALTGASGQGASGGGGTATSSNNGGSSASSALTTLVAIAGGNSGGNVVTGGAGSTAGAATAGGNGAEWTSAGSGSGGGGSAVTGTATGGNGGNYGGGGGGAAGSTARTSGVGRQGIIVVTYTPLLSVFAGNIPMLGM